jgi:threonine synthase
VAGDAEDEEILAAQTLLARTEGIWAGPTGVAALAVLIRLLEARTLDPAQSICVIVSETGLKTEAAAPRPEALTFDEDSLRHLVTGRLAARS